MSSVDQVVNVTNINKTIRELREDKHYPFDMQRWDMCIGGFTSRACGTSLGTTGVAEAFGISWEKAFDITMPNSKNRDATRKEAIRLLENLRDTSLVDWDYACPSFWTKAKTFLTGLVIR